MQLVTTWFGSFLLSEGKVTKSMLFPQDPEAIADRLQKIEDWQVLDEEKDLMRGLREYFVFEPRLERAGGSFVRDDPPFISPEEHGFDRVILHQSMIVLGKRRMRKTVGVDTHLSQAIATLDDLQEAENLLIERLREWYGLHFPELVRMVKREDYIELVATRGNREAMPVEYGESIGGALPEEERLIVMQLASQIRTMSMDRMRLGHLIERRMKELAPNVAGLVGPVIGARLVALAGGLDELAKLPASTIQLLGAEKALFRHLKDHTKPPKHGVIFQHPLIHQAPYWQRGGISRVFASKIAIAARADFFSRRVIVEQLKADLEKAVGKLKERKAEPPPLKPRKKRRKDKKRKRRR